MTEHPHGHTHASMISVEEALGRILDVVPVLEAEDRPVLDALGQVLAGDVFSDLDIPPMMNSAMDGYAVQADSVGGASDATPVVLRVTDTVAAGQVPGTEVTPGTAVRIMTGAPIPAGADTVVPFEDTDEQERKAGGIAVNEITVRVEAPQGAYTRPAGQDVARGDLVLAGGTVLRPADIGVLASLGRNAVNVIRRPRVALLATGDELIEPGSELTPGKIFNSNTYSLAASIAHYGGIPRILGIAEDSIESMNAKLEEARDSDILITSAGVSRGDYDIVKDVLAQHGEISFWTVRMRPAKPLAFGVLEWPDGRSVPHLGLPGNPVSALVAFEQFGRPAVFKMIGKTGFGKPTIQAVLEEPVHNADGRRVYARVVITKRDGTYYASLTGHQSSNLLTSMARANGLAICPEDVPMKNAGEVVNVEMLDWPEEIF